MFFEIKESNVSHLFSLLNNEKIEDWLEKNLKKGDQNVTINLILNNIQLNFAEWFLSEFTKKQKMEKNFTEGDFLNELKASYELMVVYKMREK